MRIVLQIWLAVMTISLTACTTVFSEKGSQQLRLPMGVGSGISDALCSDIKDISIPKRLQELGIPFEWTNQTKGLLSAGPLTEESEGVHSTIRQTYFLNVTCSDELTTSISGEAILEGLNASGQWVGITDTATIEHHSMLFLQQLNL